MSDPVGFSVSYSFAGYQSNSPQSPLPGPKLDGLFNSVQSSVNSLVDAVKDVRRSDGALKNAIVTYDSLDPALQSAGLLPLAAWAGSTVYPVGRVVVQNYILYQCAVAHTSGVFATDLNAGKWTVLTALPLGPQGTAGAAATVTVGTVTTGNPGTNAAVANGGSTSAAVLNFTIPRGDVGATGNTGPAAWSAPVAWLTGTAYVAGPPASVVTQSGETYVCLVSHTAGTFATDLAANKWLKVAAKGADGAGTISGGSAHGVAIASGASSIGSVAAVGTAGRVLVDQGGSADPSFQAVSGDATFSSGGVLTIAAGAITFAKIAGAALATAAQYLANTASLILTTDKVWSAAVPVALTDASTVTPDFGAGIDFIWTVGATGRTLANPSNVKAGQKGVIYLIQDATGSRTITTWGTQYKFGFGGAKPALSTAANAVDILSYVVKSATEIECFFTPSMS